MPRSILFFCIRFFNEVYEPHVHTNGTPAIYFYASCGYFYTFWDCNIGHVSDKKRKEKKRPAFRLSVGP